MEQVKTHYINMTIKVLLLFMLLIPLFYVAPASAQVQILRPVPGALTSGMGPRWGRNHNGSDYSAGVGTPITITPGYIGAPDYRGLDGNGAGRRLHLNYNCGVRVSFFHLSSYSPGPPIAAFTGDSGASGDGSYAPHLHIEIRIDGQVIEPEAAYGLDLCDSTIAECLKQDGRQRVNGAIPRGEQMGVCGGGGTPYSGPPPLTPGENGTEPLDSDGDASLARPPITPPTYTPPTLSGGPEDDVGPPPGGPVLWDTTEYLVGNLSDNACNLDVFVAMRGRAAMEAQEDIVASEMVVHRPDSVMEYTCLDQYMGFTAERADTFFSARTNWQGTTIALWDGTDVAINVFLDPTSLDQILEETVVRSIFDYVSQQFPLAFLGDTSGGLDSSISNTIGGASYTCTTMSDVWLIAKCENFADSRYFTGPGPFYTFNEMIPNTNDPRTQYNACNDTGLMDVDIQAMTNAGFAYFGNNPATLPGINIHDYVDPAVCTGLEPIQTGINVLYFDDFSLPTEVAVEYEEYFCPNPGCYYDHTSGTCSK